MQNSILDNYKVILINQVINEVNSGKITIKEFAKKLNCTQKRLKDKLNGKYLTIDIVIEMCEALDIDIYEYVDKEKLDEALLKEYKGIYPYIPDSNKLMIVSDMERILKIDNEDKLYKPRNRLLNKIYREIYIDKNITIINLFESGIYG